MPRKKYQNVELSQLSSANANSASGDQPGHDSDGNDTEQMPLTWEKIADKILEKMNDRFDKLEQTLQIVQSSQKELMEKVESVEEGILDHESCITCLEKTVSGLKDDHNALKLKVDDLEGRSRRNNIKIIGIPENEGGGKPTEFVEALILKLFGEGSFRSPVVIDRAHRVLRPPPTAGANPRAIIARIHFYREKELILGLRRDRQLDSVAREPLFDQGC
ncbi:hypothetical protein PBY51_023934 [Eleginops maclovinus]|uniref:L1 transposable element RRM domain-containing protein n=1 Tax=Eleginops maclovinus TaxID=56733 RepID=A0AAN7WVH6_ELEMC|nr:hypothetical protein PBY51_023934 [Eleginops maclovinus]